MSLWVTHSGPGSSVGIATDYGLDGPRSNPGGDEIFRPSRPALGPTQPSVQWVPGLPGVKCGRSVLLTTHPLLVPRSWKSRAIPLDHTGPVTGTFCLHDWRIIKSWWRVRLNVSCCNGRRRFSWRFELRLMPKRVNCDLGVCRFLNGKRVCGKKRRKQTFNKN